MKQYARDAHRHALGWMAVGTANVMKGLIKNNYKQELLENHRDFLSNNEARVLEASYERLKAAEKGLRAIAKVLLKDEGFYLD